MFWGKTKDGIRRTDRDGMRLEQMSSNIYFPDSVLRILKSMLLLGLSVLLNVMKHVSAEMSFETWKIHYASVTAVPRSVTRYRWRHGKSSHSNSDLCRPNGYPPRGAFQKCSWFLEDAPTVVDDKAVSPYRIPSLVRVSPNPNSAFQVFCVLSHQRWQW